MIPKRLIQTNRSLRHLSTMDKSCRASLLKLHPDWEVMFFDDAGCLNFVKSLHPDFLPLYKALPKPVLKADLFRLLAVYEYGGFYCDTDVYFHEPLDPLVSENIVFPWEWTMAEEGFRYRHKRVAKAPWELVQMGNYAFGACGGHWFLAEVLEEVIRRTSRVNLEHLSDDDVLYLTGPDVVNGTRMAHWERLAPELKLLEGEKDPKPPKPRAHGAKPEWFQFGRFANHVMAGSWRSQG